MEHEINLPDVVAEVTAAFIRHAAALTAYGVATPDGLFLNKPSA